MLPRYWPQWNPIELVWNWMKDMLGDRLGTPCRPSGTR